MVNEMYDIIDVKNEYINALGEGLKQQFNIQAIEAGLVILNDFCNNIRANNIVLVKMEPEPKPKQILPQYPPTQQQYIPPVQQPYTPPTQQQFVQQTRPVNPNPFVEDEEARREEAYLRQEYEKRAKAEEMRKKVENLNKSLNEDVPPPIMRDDISLAQQKPKSFMDRVKQYKAPNEQLNDEDADSM